MYTEAVPLASPQRKTSAGPVLRLDDLLTYRPTRLRHLYESASVPRLEAISGDLRGRMLAWPSAGPLVSTALRLLASADRFPWRGKSFVPYVDGGVSSAGEGINRVGIDALRLFRFQTFVGRSRAGAFDAVQLDYDLPENPFYIRAVKDEIRELRPGLYLGQAWLAARGKSHLVLYFALEDRRVRPCAPS